jgi:hypothetical protein
MRGSFGGLGALLVLGAFALVGCGGPTTVTISGKVTFDGQPVEQGLISFQDVEGKVGPAENAITNGEYKVTDMPRGMKKVVITGSRKIGERPAYAGDPNSPMIPITESYIPAKFNDKTTLTYDAQKTGTQNFDLKSKD